MASLSAAIQHIRRTRRQLDTPRSENFDRYRGEYEAVLQSIEELAGGSAFEELHEWMVRTTKERKRLPTPDEVRSRARDICSGRDITVPSNSPLRD